MHPEYYSDLSEPFGAVFEIQNLGSTVDINTSFNLNFGYFTWYFGVLQGIG